MNARQWMRVAAVASAMGLAATAFATEIDTDAARRDGSAVTTPRASSYGSPGSVINDGTPSNRSMSRGTKTINGPSMPDASTDSQNGTTSFDSQTSLDSAASPNPEPDAASRSSNGAINGAVPGSVDRAAGSSMSNRQLPTD